MHVTLYLNLGSIYERKHMRCLFFRVWLVLLNTMISSSAKFPANDTMTVFFMDGNDVIVYVCMYSCCPSVDERLGWFIILAVVNSTVVSVDGHIAK